MRTRTPLACLTQTWPVTRVTKIDSQSSSHSMYISPSSFLRFYLSFLLSVIPPLASLSLELASRLSLSLSLWVSPLTLSQHLSPLSICSIVKALSKVIFYTKLSSYLYSRHNYMHIFVYISSSFMQAIYAIYDSVVLCFYYLLMKIGVKVFD